MAYIGGDIDQLQTLNRRFGEQSNAVDALRQRLDADVASADWRGGRADRFRDDWEREFRPALLRLRDALDDMGREAGVAGTDLINVGGR